MNSSNSFLAGSSDSGQTSFSITPPKGEVRALGDHLWDQSVEGIAMNSSNSFLAGSLDLALGCAINEKKKRINKNVSLGLSVLYSISTFIHST
jgi:hypothetical protein